MMDVAKKIGTMLIKRKSYSSFLLFCIIVVVMKQNNFLRWIPGNAYVWTLNMIFTGGFLGYFYYKHPNV